MKTIAYLGPEKTNTHLAAQKKFGPRGRFLHAPTVEEVFQMVERRRADFGVVPVENSLEGAVTHTLDRFIDFMESPAKIYGEMEQPIRHFLIFHPASSIARIRAIYSHPQALAQCQGWAAKHCPLADLRERNSTAEAIRDVLEDKPGAPQRLTRAAIGRKELARGRALKAVPIPIGQENRTRFLVISLAKAKPGRRNKTSILFALKDRPGALHDALNPFKREGINLTKIESRPSKRKAWEYVFFIDFEGHESEPRVKRALAGLTATTRDLRILGSYPMPGAR